MEKAYFSEIKDRIIPYLNEAQTTIQVAMAWFTSGELFNALLKSTRKGVEVELILLDNAINFMDYAPDFNLFIKAGGKLRIAGSVVGFMHHKFCIVDDRIVITGSYNWTYYAETRNVENIVITDNVEIINLFKSEFLRLKNKLALSTTSQRLTWDEIEARTDVNFHELNYEIERICEVQNKLIRRVFETKTEVVRTEIKLTPYSKHSIGIQALDDNDNVIFDSFIDKGQILPWRSSEKELYFDSKNFKEFPCLFIYGNPNDMRDWHLIKDVNLMQIAKDTSDDNLPVKFSMNLDDNGSLRIDISCAQSGQRLTISALDSNFVKYE